LVIVLLAWDCAKTQPQIGLFAFELCKRVDAAKMEGFCHAHLHTLWIAAAQVALCCFLKGFIQVHVFEGAGHDAQPASVTHLFVDDNGRRLRIALYRTDRARVHAERGFTLQACTGVNPPPVHVHIYKYIWATAFVSFRLLKQTGLFAAQTGDTPIEFNKYNVHSVHFHYSI
jgi:hypothetical protein